MLPYYAQIALKLLLATLAGGLVGYQRERAERPAGLRTHILVSLGSAIFTIASLVSLPNTDPTRIAAQIVTGIGFLGAGAIINQGDLVLGLTTAASLWATAGLGMLAGFGLYPVAIGASVLVFIVLSVFKPIEKKIAGGEERGTIVIRVEKGNKELILKVDDVLKGSEIHSKSTELTKVSGLTTYKYYIDLPRDADPDDIIDKLVKLDGVESVRWEGAGK